MDRENTPLAYVTFEQIIEELQSRNIPFVILRPDEGGINFYTTRGMKASTMMRILNHMIGRFIEYIERMYDD